MMHLWFWIINLIWFSFGIFIGYKIVKRLCTIELPNDFTDEEVDAILQEIINKLQESGKDE